MNQGIKAALFGGAIFCAGIADAGDSYKIYGPTTTATDNPYYSWNGVNLSDFRSALESYNNFSHYSSVVDTKIWTRDFDQLATLDVVRRADCIISPWWSELDMGINDVAFATYHFFHGGDLLLFNDDQHHDAIAEDLGIPTLPGAYDETLTGNTLAFTGPFGNPGTVQAKGVVGHLDLVTVFNTGGQVLALNAAGEVMAAFWDDGAFAPGAGRMIIVTDINTITTGLGDSTYFPLNAHGRFGLNLIAGLIGENPCNPADCDGNGILNFDDIDCFINNFLSGCP